jgi:hypothetical protein
VSQNNAYDLDQVFFFEICLDIASKTESPLSLTSTLVSPTIPKFDKLDDSARSRLTDRYPAAFTDFHGTPSGAPCVYKTGSTWPKPKDGQEAQPYTREMRPVHNHPILPS